MMSSNTVRFSSSMMPTVIAQINSPFARMTASSRKTTGFAGGFDWEIIRAGRMQPALSP